MENAYILTIGKKGFLVLVVNTDNANGRYQLFSVGMNNVHHNIYETIENVENEFDFLVETKIIDNWYRLAHKEY